MRLTGGRPGVVRSKVIEYNVERDGLIDHSEFVIFDNNRSKDKIPTPLTPRLSSLLS